MTGADISPIVRAFFEARVSPAKDGCWEWTGAKDRAGYGTVLVAYRGQRLFANKAHRLAFLLAHPEIELTSRSQYICHSCDNPSCVNPAHLWLGTAKENMQDAAAKGRIFNAHRGKTECIHGHAFTEENTYRLKRNGMETRSCRACAREYQKRLRIRRAR